MYHSDNPGLLPNIFKDYAIPFGRNKETGAFFVPTCRGGTADEMVEHYATVSAACDRAIADIDPSCSLLIAGLNQMKTDASRKSAVAVKRDKAWEFVGPGTGEKASGGPPPARRAKLADKSAKDQALRNQMKGTPGGKKGK